MTSVKEKIQSLCSKKRLPLLLGAGAVLVLALLLLLSVGGSGGGAESVFEGQAEATRDYVEAIDAANSADDIVKAIEAYTARMKELAPQLRKLAESQGEKESAETAARMAEGMENTKKSFEKMPAAMMKVQRYMMDQKVRDAFARMGEEMSAFEQD